MTLSSVEKEKWEVYMVYFVGRVCYFLGSVSP